ncbi:hypothetical protein [Rhodopirellula islandica]|uniref:hypothetical protein n=1 Tax=Rhodopirellula islandica TaxID=595434 RepID=UPI0012375636|nr:hypothetical protein [Rhodopirellula islandica]
MHADPPVFSDGDAGEFAASLLEGLIVNNQSIKSYSVAFSLEYSVMPPGRVQVRNELVRCVRDANLGRALLGRIVVADVIGADGKMEASKSTHVLQVGGRGEAIVIDGVGKRRLDLPPNIPFSRSVGMPTFHSLGVVGFPDSSSLHRSNHTAWIKQTIAEDGFEAKLSGDDTATVTRVVVRNGQETLAHAWIFDIKNIVPQRHRVFYFDTNLKKRVLKEEEVYTWRDFEGVQVPLTIRYQNKQKARAPESGELEEYVELTDTDFHWDSVGGDLEEPQTSLEQFKTIESVAEWIHAGFPKGNAD